MTITPIYAALLTLLFVALSMGVIAMRRTARVGLGDGGNRVLMRRTRVQANFAEYVPLGLLLMAFAEFQGASLWALHGIGGLLLAGRAAHSIGLSQEPEPTGLRSAGMTLTFTALIAAAIIVLGFAVGMWEPTPR